MNKSFLKYLLPGTVLVLLLIPIVSSSVMDMEQKRANELLMEEERLAKEVARAKEMRIYLMGKFDQTTRSDFSLIPVALTTVPNPMYLRDETLAAFSEMAMAAEEDGVKLKIASATRNFSYQRSIWDNKWSGATLVEGKNLSKRTPEERFTKILEYSAVPGTSRHHWGTDIDINDANPGYFNTERGEQVYAWLVENAGQFGFCQPYNQKSARRPVGYNEEKWHWSYLPLARTFTEEYKKLITDTDITGFSGDEYVPVFNLINNYVVGINAECL